MNAPPSPVVFLFDVDNTLLDNDGIIRDLGVHLDSALGPERRRRYFEVFEHLRAEVGYADYLGALQRCRSLDPTGVRLLSISAWLIEYPFASRLYPGALEAVARCSAIGPTVVLSDGDVVFQPWKVRQSGIAAAVQGRVLIYIHKEEMLADVERRYQAHRYILIDDKPRLVAAIKRAWGPRVTTVMPRQGHYANDPKARSEHPPADVAIERIGDLLGLDLTALASGDSPRH